MSDTLDDSKSTDATHKNVARPVGVTVLAVLHLIGGVLLFVTQFVLFANLQAMEDSLRYIGIPPALLIAGVMFLAVLAIASGIGMWMGTKWGWWLASFYYVYSIFRNGSALLIVIVMADQIEGGRRGPEFYMIKHGSRIIIHFLLFLYFFKGNVVAYFCLDKIKKVKAIGILVGTCIAITVVTSSFGLISNWTSQETQEHERIGLKREDSSPVKFVTGHTPIEWSFPAGWYLNPEDNPYDLQCLSKLEYMNTGIFVFERDELPADGKPIEIFWNVLNEVKSKRKIVKELEPLQIYQYDDKTVTSVTYLGEKDSSQDCYRISLIEFKSDVSGFAVTIQIANPVVWETSKQDLSEITESARALPNHE